MRSSQLMMNGLIMLDTSISSEHSGVSCRKVAAAKDTLCRAIALEEPVPDGIAQLAGHPIFIYGAGNYGRIIYSLLTQNGIPSPAILGFLDMAATENSTLSSLPVYQPHASCVTRALRKEAQVVISIYSSLAEHAAIIASLHGMGYRNVRSGYETALSFHTANDPSTRIAETGFLRASLANIMRGSQFWEDNRSLETYVNHFVGYARCDLDSFVVETDHRQYFPPSPLRVKGDMRFIDCGAFDGDTIRDLLEYSGKVESLALFEPSARNFQKLTTYVRENEGDIAEQLTLFPCGVWDSTERPCFDGTALSASAISNRGDEFIQCVAIDDVLHGFSPTCIKMDIEGAELHALRGAEETIRQCKPDLAISVYHSLSHLWEIPDLIRQWVPGYRFFLRTYGSAGFETVMYAVDTD